MDRRKKVETRRGVKLKLAGIRSERVTQGCRDKDREVKRRVKKYKRKCMEDQAEKAERAEDNGRMKDLYILTMVLTGRRRQSEEVKDINGIVRTEKSEGVARWVKHFKEVINRKESEHPAADEEMIEEVEKIDCGQEK